MTMRWLDPRRSCRDAAALPVQPDVLVAIAVVDAVDHHGHALDLWMAAGHLARVKDYRPRDVFDQPALDLPDQFLALLRVRLHRLLFDQIIDLGIAVAGVVALRAADVILV